MQFCTARGVPRIASTSRLCMPGVTCSKCEARMTSCIAHDPVHVGGSKMTSPTISQFRRFSFRNLLRYAASPRQHFDFAVDAGNDLEIALIGLALVARDDVIIAFRKHDAWERADRFLDHVAAGSEHRPLRVGERLALRVVDQLERDQGGTV